MVKDDIEWIWVDIACIDQENDSVKMYEVGKQASIFKKAANTFVWLCHSSSDTLTRSFNILESRGPELWWTYGKLPHLSLVQDIYEAAKTIFGDPWFSSLWTLQETLMRNDALILSATAEPVIVDSEYFLHMVMLINTCVNIYERLNTSLDEGTDPEEDGETLQQTRTIISNILRLIAQAGFYYTYSTNPNVQYGTAKHRRTRDKVDRVYAIMQIYNIRVGQSLRPNDRPSVEALIREFGLAINSRSPLLGQLFLHATQPQLGQSWCITEESIVPVDMLFLDYMECRATMKETNDGSVQVSGHCCSFSDWIMAQSAIRLKGLRGVFLDEHVARQVDPLNEPLFWGLRKARADSDFTSYGNYKEEERLNPWRAYATRVCNEYGEENLRVLLLGSKGANHPVEAMLESRRHFGLLLRSSNLALEQSTGVLYERIGVCMWTVVPGVDDHAMKGRPSPKSKKTMEAKIRERSWEEFEEQKNILEDLFTNYDTVTLI